MGLTPLVTGAGAPVTLIAHGFGASAAETRPLAGGVPGTRVFATARGHDGAELDGPCGYGELADDLLAVADAHAATQALGISMGAGALLRLLSRQPTRFDRVVLLLPAALDQVRTDPAVRRLEVLAGRDPAEVRKLVTGEIPVDLRAGLSAYVEARTAFLLACPGLVALHAGLAADVPVPDRSRLGSVGAQVLLLAQEGDPLHPAQVARELAGVLPNARLVVFDGPGAAIRERARLRALVSGFLGG